jgi:DNA-binding Lrp family transcriptional regulator
MPKRTLQIQTQVLRELTSPASFQWNVRESCARIAKKLGIDEETVRLAVKRAKDSGFVEKWRIFLNPDLLGQKAGAIQVEVNAVSKVHGISQIRLIDGVVVIFDFHDKGLRVIFNFETDQALERKLNSYKLSADAKKTSPYAGQLYLRPAVSRSEASIGRF